MTGSKVHTQEPQVSDARIQICSPWRHCVRDYCTHVGVNSLCSIWTRCSRK